ncbi:MAG: hypothetical protein M0Z94_14295 [Dehalococcoidales bacterium]|nr:hypothetical protein [Dehalococcoidales bacterium]
MPLALLALGLLVVLVAAILAGYGFALWVVLGLAWLGAKFLLDLGLAGVQTWDVLLRGDPPRSKKAGWNALTGAIFWALRVLTYGFPILVSLVLIGIDTGQIYPPLAPYQATIATWSDRIYGLAWLHPIGQMTLTRLIEIVLGAQAIWAVPLQAGFLVVLILTVARIGLQTPFEALYRAIFKKGNDTHLNSDSAEPVGAAPSTATIEKGD